MKSALYVLGLALLQAPATAGELETSWTPVRADLEVRIDPAAKKIVVEGTILARLDHADSSPGPTLGLNARRRIFRFVEVSAEGARVEINASQPKRPATVLAHVRFETPKKRGAEVEVRFLYESVGQAKQFVVDESVSLASWVEAWYPVLAPRPGVSLSGASKVAGRTRFLLPRSWHALSNGKLVESEEVEGGVRETWETTEAVSRSFAAGPYRVVREEAEGLDVALYLLSYDTSKAGKHVQALARAIEAQEARLGPYPYPSYGIAEIPLDRGSFGAASEQGFIMVKPNFLNVPGGNLPLFAHEAAHGWWGNTVGTRGPGKILCSESLAQYGAVLAIEALEGSEAATEFLRFSRAGYVSDQCARGYFGILASGEDHPLSQLASNTPHAHTLSDSKGHWVYHMLRRRVGDDVFFTTLRGLIERFAGRSMSLDDARAAFLEAAPDARLEVFFEQWLDRLGAPVLEHEHQAIDGGIRVTIRQKQPGSPYELDLEVALVDVDGRSDVRSLRIRSAEEDFTLATTEEIARVVLDPAHRLLLWDEAYGVPPFAEDERLSAEEIEMYCGTYDIEGRDVSLRVYGQDGRIRAKISTGETAQLRREGEHTFRTSVGIVRFLFEGEKVTALELERPNGSRTRATRKDVR